MNSRLFVQILVLLLATSELAFAHRVFHEITKKEAVLVTAEYDDGEPMGYAAVKVYSPAGGKIEHQNGRTDKNGCFAFVPDSPGRWRITIDGEMGHLIDTTFAVDEALGVVKKEETGRGCSRWHGVATGLGVIFGLCGFACYIRARKSPIGG
jgi:nickel transport protein